MNLFDYLDGKPKEVDPNTAPDGVRHAMAQMQGLEPTPVPAAPEPTDYRKMIDSNGAKLADAYERMSQPAPRAITLPTESVTVGAPPASAGMGDVKLVEANAGLYDPAPKKIGHVKVGMPASAAEPLTYRPFETLSKLIPTGPKAAAAPAQDDELKGAQQRAALDRLTAHTGRLMADGAWRGQGMTSDDAAFADSEKNADAPVRDVLARREEGRKKIEGDQKAAQFQRETEENDPSSQKSRAATLLAQSQGLIGKDQSISASQYHAITSGAGVQAQREESAARLAQEKNNSEAQRQLGWATLHSHESEAQQQRDLLLQLEREKEAARLQEAGLKKKEAHAQISGKMADELAAQNTAEEANKKLKDAHDDVGLSAYIPHGKVGPITIPSVGAQRKYEETTKALSPALSAGLNPGARGNAGIIKDTEQRLPAGMTPDGMANVFFDSAGKAIHDRKQRILDDAQARGVPEAELNALGGGAAHSAQSVGPHGPTVKQNGHTYTWNPQSGRYE